MSTDLNNAQRLFSKLSRNLDKVTEDPSAEHVHHLRTSVRRIEALVSTGHGPSKPKDKFLKQFADLRERAGKVRDIDVQTSALKSVQLEGQYEHKHRVSSALARRRAKKVKKLTSLLSEWQEDSPRRLAKAKARILEQLAKQDQASKTDYYALACQLFSEASQQYGAGAGGTINAKHLHNFRLAVKRVRYTAELAGNRPETKALVNELKRVQDAIGEWHDWQMLWTTASDELKDEEASGLNSILENITGAKFAAAIHIASQVIDRRLRDSNPVPKKRPASVRTVRQKAAGF